mgnify:CR=1 FL=1
MTPDAMKLEARTATAESADFDLVLQSGVRIELDRLASGAWRFWNVVLPTGERFGGSQLLSPDAAAWFESRVDAFETKGEKP